MLTPLGIRLALFRATFTSEIEEYRAETLSSRMGDFGGLVANICIIEKSGIN